LIQIWLLNIKDTALAAQPGQLMMWFLPRS